MARYEHGTRASYTLNRCRCPHCTQANRQYQAQYARANLYGRSRWHHDMDPVRDHIAALREAGYGLRTIAAAAGTTRKQLQHILGQRGGRPPATRIYKTTATAILAIPLPDADDGTGSTIPESGMDEVAIWRHLNGDHTPHLTRAERLEVIRSWRAAGRPLAELQRDTGWNVHRDIRSMQAAS